MPESHRQVLSLHELVKRDGEHVVLATMQYPTPELSDLYQTFVEWNHRRGLTVDAENFLPWLLVHSDFSIVRSDGEKLSNARDQFRIPRSDS